MYYVYIIRSMKSGQYYIGQTQDVAARLARHNSGGCTATRGRGPWELACVFEFPTRSAAMMEERRLKQMKSRAYLEAMIAANVRHG